jgi:hypothetical protein
MEESAPKRKADPDLRRRLKEAGKTESRAMGRVVAACIAAWGKVQPGDKTVVEPLVPSLDALEANRGDERALIDATIATAAPQSTKARGLGAGARYWACGPGRDR